MSVDWPEAGPIDLAVHDAPHASSSTEWWYLHAHVETDDGRPLSFFAAVFRILKPSKHGDAPGGALSDEQVSIRRHGEAARIGEIVDVLLDAEPRRDGELRSLGASNNLGAMRRRARGEGSGKRVDGEAPADSRGVIQVVAECRDAFAEAGRVRCAGSGAHWHGRRGWGGARSGEDSEIGDERRALGGIGDRLDHRRARNERRGTREEAVERVCCPTKVRGLQCGGEPEVGARGGAADDASEAGTRLVLWADGVAEAAACLEEYLAPRRIPGGSGGQQQTEEEWAHAQAMS